MTEQRARELPKQACNEIESEPQIDDSFTGLQKRQLAMFQRALSERDHYPEALRTVYVNLLRVPGDHAAAIAGFAKAILDGKTLQEAYKVAPPPTALAESAKKSPSDSVREALERAPSEERLTEIVRTFNYKYFGDYEMSEDQRAAVDDAELAIKAVQAARAALQSIKDQGNG